MRLRPATPLLVLLLAAGCSKSGSRLLADPSPLRPDGGGRGSERYRQGVTELDLLLVVDDSSGMAPAQQVIARELGVALKELEGKELDWRLGVISSDLGIAPFQGPGCFGSGQAARLQGAPRLPGCAALAEPWLGGASTTDPAAAIACIASLGESGCGFERPLQAALLALDGQQAPARNVGFLREEAGLLLVLLTNEDDCSARDPALYDPDAVLLGPWTSYRCFEHDVSCSGVGPGGALQGCASGKGRLLLPVSEAAAALSRLRPPGSLEVMVVAGPPQDIRVVRGASGESELAPSCTGEGISARPAVRLAELVAALRPAARSASICWSVLLRNEFRQVLERLRHPPYHCLRRPLRDPTRPACSVEVTAASGEVWSVPPGAPGIPGFHILHPLEPGCEAGALVFDAGALPPTGAWVELRCDFAAATAGS